MIRKNYIVLLILSSFFCSCSKESGEGTDPNAPVGLDARIAGVSLITRGGAAEAKDISSLGIYAVNKASKENAYGNAPAGTYCAYKIKGGIASPSEANAPLWLCQEQAIIFSCHPAPKDPAAITSNGSGQDPIPTVTIPKDAITLVHTGITAKGDNIYDFAEPKNDYMYGVAYDANKANEAEKFLTTQPVADNGRKTSGNTVINTSGPSVAIGLKHAFAQIKLVISKGDSYQGDAKITKVGYTRKMKTLKEGSTMSLKEGVLANTSAAGNATYSFTFKNGVATAAGSPVTLVNYVLPNEAAASTFTVMVDGKEMTMEHNTDPKWAAGAIYTYTLTINGTGLALSGFTVVGWGDETQSDIPNL